MQLHCPHQATDGFSSIRPHQRFNNSRAGTPGHVFDGQNRRDLRSVTGFGGTDGDFFALHHDPGKLQGGMTPHMLRGAVDGHGDPTSGGSVTLITATSYISPTNHLTTEERRVPKCYTDWVCPDEPGSINPGRPVYARHIFGMGQIPLEHMNIWLACQTVGVRK